PPGMAEPLDWSRALLALGTVNLSEEAVNDSLGVILKYQEDVDTVRGDIAANLVGRALLQTI
ncbi:MAG: MoxR family ATPase, partial [Thermomicrobiales bacterium]|nr:MoxR family ATPase [Thermomicrobiales bacterium]